MYWFSFPFQTSTVGTTVWNWWNYLLDCTVNQILFVCLFAFLIGRIRLGMMGHACNPSTLEGQGKQIAWVQEFEISLGTMTETHLYKNTTISQAWWCVSVVLATCGAEVGELLELGRERLQWAQIAPPHSNLGDRVRLCLRKIKTNWKRERERERELTQSKSLALRMEAKKSLRNWKKPEELKFSTQSMCQDA